MTAADPIQLLLDKQFTVADLARLRSLVADSGAIVTAAMAIDAAG